MDQAIQTARVEGSVQGGEGEVETDNRIVLRVKLDRGVDPIGAPAVITAVG